MNSVRLIDADLLKQNCKITGQFENNFQCVDLITLGSVIDEQPTVEAKPVVHGKWIEEKEESYWFSYTCSQCGELEDFNYNFCPNCGADMRGGKNEN